MRDKLIINGRLNADVVGQSAQRLGELFGIEVPPWTRIIVGEVRWEREGCEGWMGVHRTALRSNSIACRNRLSHLALHPHPPSPHTSPLPTNPAEQIDVIGVEEPLSQEKLCPVLAMYRAADFEEATKMADRLVRCPARWLILGRRRGDRCWGEGWVRDGGEAAVMADRLARRRAGYCCSRGGSPTALPHSIRRPPPPFTR